ncbi:MAG: hypothetical protein P8Y71_00310 [Pseudolabrys sp.]
MAKRTTGRSEILTRKTERKDLQRAKIREIGEAVIASGFGHVEEQSKVLNVPRSTAWVILQAKHKASGLSASIIKRMLTSPDLPPTVRKKILEYIDEKANGLYGDSNPQLLRFKAKLLKYGILSDDEIDLGRSQRQTKAFNGQHR